MARVIAAHASLFACAALPAFFSSTVAHAGVALLPQTVAFATPLDTRFGDLPFSIANLAFSSSGLPVLFDSLTPTVCTTNGAGDLVTPIALGTCTLRASQPGNATYQPATPVSRSFRVLASSPLTLQSSIGPARYGGMIMLTATLPRAGATGVVTFSHRSTGVEIDICKDVILVAGRATCALNSNMLPAGRTLLRAHYNGSVGDEDAYLEQAFNPDTSTLSVSTSPVRPLAGRTVTLRAMVTARQIDGTVAFRENGQVLPGCGAVTPVVVPHGAQTANAGIATCVVNAVPAGTHDYVVTYTSPSLIGFEQTVVTVATRGAGPESAADYSGMWWKGAVGNGWGMSITQRDGKLFAVIYAYNDFGAPVWFVMPNGTWSAGGTVVEGDLYQPTGTPFSRYDGVLLNVRDPVGHARFVLEDQDHLTLNYTIRGVNQSHRMERQAYASNDTGPRLDVSDLWWGGAGDVNGWSQNGWGLNIAQRGTALFLTWYTYDATGTATWFVVPEGTWDGNTYRGTVYATRGSPWLGVNYNAAALQVRKVGELAIDFFAQDVALMSYTVNGFMQTRQITRQPF